MTGPTFASAPAAAVAPPPAARPRPTRPAAPKPEPAAPTNLVLTYLKLHWLAILFIGSLVGAGLGYAAYTLTPVKYESYAQIQVASAPFTFASGNDPQRGQTAFATYIKTLRTRFKSELVLDAALNDDKFRIARTPTLTAQPDPVKYLEENLMVESSEGSEVIRVSLEGKHAEDLKPIVDAVVAAFMAQVVERDVTEKNATRQKLDQLRVQYEQDLRKLVGATGGANDPARSSFARPNAAPLAGPDVVQALGAADGGPALKPAGAVGPPTTAGVALTETPEFKRDRAKSLIAGIVSMESDTQRYPHEIKKAQAQVEELERQVAAAQPTEPTPQALTAAEQDPEVAHQLALAQRDESNAQALRGMARDKNAAVIRTALDKAAAARTRANAARLTKARELEQPALQSKMETLSTALQRAKANVGDLQERERITTAQLEQAKKALAAIQIDVQKAEEKEKRASVDTKESELLVRDRLFRDMTQQQIVLGMEIQSPSRVQVPQQASTPRQKDSKKQLMAALAAVLVSFGAVGGGLIGYEFQTRKVSSLAELSGGAPVVGVIPFSPDAAATDPLKRADIAAAIDKLRATVAQEWLSRGPTTLVVTSAVGDEGKAFTAYRLATSLAQGGVRTLLVDFDLRTPALHEFAGVPNVGGVAEILRGEADVTAGQIVLPSGLALLPAGTWVAPLDADSGPLMGAALEPLVYQLRAGVDCLVLHGHGLLTAADTVDLARRADAVLVCAFYRHTRTPLLKRATDRIASMFGPSAGVVYLGATRHEALC